jgi:hypothetical protein
MLVSNILWQVLQVVAGFSIGPPHNIIERAVLLQTSRKQ